MVLVSICITYYLYEVKKDYLVYVNIDCDPSSERCFYIPCEDEQCSKDIEYYKKISKKAYNIDNCDLSLPDCKPMYCLDGEGGCLITSCSEDVLEPGEVCTN